MVAAAARIISTMGRKKGIPMINTPPRMGNAATATVAMGTVGTNSNFTAGTFFGKSLTKPLTVPTAVSEMMSTAPNQLLASLITAEISGRYGPSKRSLSLRVGGCSVSEEEEAELEILDADELVTRSGDDLFFVAVLPLGVTGSKLRMSH
jgi:hypothetical protein